MLLRADGRTGWLNTPVSVTPQNIKCSLRALWLCEKCKLGIIFECLFCEVNRAIDAGWRALLY